MKSSTKQTRMRILRIVTQLTADPLEYAECMSVCYPVQIYHQGLWNFNVGSRRSGGKHHSLCTQLRQHQRGYRYC